MFKPQNILQNRYQLETELGNNANRQTWLATDLKTSSPVVVKLLAFNPLIQWEELKLFEREAQVLQNINHPRIPEYLDYFSVEKSSKNELPYFGLVQKYIPGTSVKKILEKGKKFSQNQARYLAEDILEILIYLHELSPPVLHRDIKPSNIILGKDDQFYLVDFGAVQDKAKAEGVTFTVVGTSGYAPPEQLWGKAVPASDLYALGATVIHLLTGTSPADLPQRQMRIDFSSKVELNPDFNYWLEQLIQPAPERRFATAKQALTALQTIEVRKAEKQTKDSPNYAIISGIFGTVLVGIYGSFYLPNLLNKIPQAQQAKQAEAKNYLGSMNRAQQAYWLENKTFTDSVEQLGISIVPETENYSYSVDSEEKSTFHYGIAKEDKIKSYVGAVYVGIPKVSTLSKQETTLSILCEADSPGQIKLPAPTFENGELSCPKGTTNLGY
ncbi:MAG: type IV pilin-like G/H family protein [Oscillatoria sp. PMC 1051.18]|nr:type IV pilin-like G/H family protein [Oscillatoria sp. PMC 1050.18]MEC5032845.1 type IV pilin-like G/H family protein [Oscillatoria sp. PMC 1051.18]